jgi:CheY-like chemotaxis protein
MRAESTVLVIDDDPAVQDVVTQALSGEGYGVLAAGDGAEALTVISQHQQPGVRGDSYGSGCPNGRGVDLILLDLWMPGMDGWTFLEHYRRLPGPHAPVVIFAAQSDEVAARQSRALGAAGFLTKPFDLEALLGVVEALGA